MSLKSNGRDMSDYKKRIKTLERRLDIDEQDQDGINKVVIVIPHNSEDETDAEYIARMERDPTVERLPDEPGEPVRYGQIIHLGREGK